MLVQCPHCSLQVIPTSDGVCPSCRKSIATEHVTRTDVDDGLSAVDDTDHERIHEADGQTSAGEPNTDSTLDAEMASETQPPSEEVTQAGPVRPIACRGFGSAIGICFAVAFLQAIAGILLRVLCGRPGENLSAVHLFTASGLAFLFVAFYVLKEHHDADTLRVVAWRYPGLLHMTVVILLVAPLLLSALYTTNTIWNGFALTGPSAIDWSLLEDQYAALAREPWWLVILVGCILPAVAEELFFRGLIGRGLVAAYGVWIGVLLTSLLFGFFHLQPERIVGTFLLGIAFHFVYLTTKSLVAPMALHGLNNLLVISESRYEQSGGFVPTQGDELLYMPGSLVLGALCAAVMLLIVLWRTRTKWGLPNGELWSAGFVSAEMPPWHIGATAKRSVAGQWCVSLASGTYLMFAVAIGFASVSWTALTYANQALILSDTGDTRADDLSKRAVQLAPNLSWVHSSRGWVLMNWGATEEALEHCETAIRLDPLLWFAYCVRASIRQAEEAYESAVADCDMALRLNDTIALPYSTRAASKLGLGECSSAVEDATTALELDPECSLALAYRGAARVELTEYELAIEDLTEAITLAPEFAYAWSCRAAAHYGMDNYAAASDDATRALRIDPEDLSALQYRGLSCQCQGNLDEAIADFTQSLAYDSSQDDTLLLRGRAHLENEDPHSAIADFSVLLERYPDDDEVFLLRAAAYRASDDEEKADQDENKASELQLWASIQQAWQFYDAGQYKRAIAEADLAIQRFPDESTLYFVRAAAHWQLEQYERAIEDYSSAAQLDPKNAEIYLNRGELYRETADYAKSIADFTVSIQLNADCADAYLGRAQAYAEAGEQAKSDADYARARQLEQRSE
jgi:tetratricopeptide (TPR) repeat protein/membrane protease YdiL (CAAX protease family)